MSSRNAKLSSRPDRLVLLFASVADQLHLHKVPHPDLVGVIDDVLVVLQLVVAPSVLVLGYRILNRLACIHSVK